MIGTKAAANYVIAKTYGRYSIEDEARLEVGIVIKELELMKERFLDTEAWKGLVIHEEEIEREYQKEKERAQNAQFKVLDDEDLEEY